MNILEKIKKANLIGRGGGGFPVAGKWQMVKKAEGEKKYVVCNAAEGEPDVLKDGYILDKYPEKIVRGLELAINYLQAEKAIVYLNPKYYGERKIRKGLEKAISHRKIEIFNKPKEAGYIGGEETSALNAIEGRRIEPRFRPPYPPTKGLWDCPTLVNNVETFYNIALVDAGDYQNKRFYTIGGDCVWTGVFELPADWTIKKVLEETKNYPDFDFFVQAGGGANGEIWNSGQLDRPASGAGSITVYSRQKYQPIDLIKKWAGFFFAESCGQCTPCREGVYRLKEAIEAANPDWKLVDDLLNNLSETAFCGLGSCVPVAIKSYMLNVVNK